MIVTVLLILLGAAVMVPLLQRDLTRAVRRAQLRALTRRRVQAAGQFSITVNARPFREAMAKAEHHLAELKRALDAIGQAVPHDPTQPDQEDR